MKNLILQKNKTNSGFTLVETLVAISIFTIAVLTMLIVLSQGISSTLYAKKKAIAGYLAQEGVEYIRNVRDTHVLYDSSSAQAGWTTFRDTTTVPKCNQVSGCYFNPDTLFALVPPQPITRIPITTCGATCPSLLFNSATGRYGYTTGINSGFIRKIRVINTTPDEVTVTSTVYWTQGSGNYQVTLSQKLYNWVE